MSFSPLPVLAVIAICFTPGCSSTANAKEVSNEEIVTQAMTQLFIQRDATAISRYWDASYIQHNPTLPNGPPTEILANLPPNFAYELGFVVSEGSLVMVHGRYTGLAAKPMIAVDIFRVKSGKLVEHWDTLQEEVAPADTVSGNAMFDPTEGS